MKRINKIIPIAVMTLLGCGIAPVPTASAQSQPTVMPSSTQAASSAGANPQPKFADMTNRDRNAILAEIGKEDFTSIFKAFVDARRVENDPMKQGDIQSTLAYAIRQRTPPPEFFVQLKAFIADDANSKLERGMTIGILALGATKESADLLIYEATSQKDQELREEAIHAIGGLGDRSQDEKLVPALEKLWQGSHDQQILAYTAMALAEIGATSSVQMLTDAAFGPQDKDNRKGAAFGALDDIRSPNAVPPLAAVFNKSTPGALEFQMAGDILVKIGDATAAQALLARLENLDDIDPAQVKQWMQDAQAPALRKALTVAVDPAVPFRNEKIRSIIRATLEEDDHGRAVLQQNIPAQK